MNMFAKNIIIVLISYAYQPGALYTVHQAAFDGRHYKLCCGYIYMCIHIYMHTYNRCMNGGKTWATGDLGKC